MPRKMFVKIMVSTSVTSTRIVMDTPRYWYASTVTMMTRSPLSMFATQRLATNWNSITAG